MQVLTMNGSADSATRRSATKRGVPKAPRRGVPKAPRPLGGLRAETDNLFASAERNLLVLRLHQSSGRFTLRRCIALQRPAQHGRGLRLADFADLGAANLNKHVPASFGKTVDPKTDHARAVSGDLSIPLADRVTITESAAPVSSYQFPEFQK
jgi:hypothetical protein